MIEVSVVIPTYNRAGRLPKALSSVLLQKGASFEVLVVDDGSTDETRTLMARDFPEVRYFHQPNQGPSAARNHGIREAKGRWIAFLDSDDEWLPGKLKAQLHYLHKYPQFKIAQTEEIWIRNGVRVNPMKKHQKAEGPIFEKCLALCLISPSAVMIHRKLFEQVGLFDESLPACEDYDLWLRITARYPVGLLKKDYTIRYGGHPDQRSREFKAMDRFRILSLIKILSEENLLDTEQEHAARNMLQKKVFIYTNGALKRGDEVEARRVSALVQKVNDGHEKLSA